MKAAVTMCVQLLQANVLVANLSPNIHRPADFLSDNGKLAEAAMIRRLVVSGRAGCHFHLFLRIDSYF